MLARIGRLCHDRRRWVLLFWLLFTLLGLAGSALLTGRLGGMPFSRELESVAGQMLVADHSPYGERVSAVVTGARADDPRLRDALRAAASDLRRESGVARVLSPAQSPPPPGLVGKDGRSVLIHVDLDRLHDADQRRRLDRVQARLRAITSSDPALRVTVGSATMLQDDLSEQAAHDTAVGEAIALPVTLLAMVVIFGGLIPAGIPLLGAVASIAGGILALLGFSLVLDLDPSVLSVTSVLGLGLSIDYSLLLVSRFREELDGGTATRPALERTMATAGRTIAFSGLTVAISLAGLFLLPSPIFRAVASAGVGVVLLALVVALTLTPAVMASASSRLRPRRPLRGSDQGSFTRLARACSRRPLLVTVGVALVLAAVASPFLGVRLQNSGAEMLPPHLEGRRFSDLLTRDFIGEDRSPITVVANTDAATLQVWALGLQKRARLAPFLAAVGPASQVAPGLSSVTLLAPGSSNGDRAQRAVTELRAERPPYRLWVTGSTAGLVDFRAEMVHRGPWALLMVGVATLVLLFLMTGSLLIPVKALVMNLLSLGSCFGLLVLIFQDGRLSWLLGRDPPGGIETFVPILVLAFAFGLSMDYEVFLLGRIKELHDAGFSTTRAVELGLQRSGRIITSAAVLMMIVFAGFATGKTLPVKELGIALTAAVAVDATLVRCLLVPATMRLLGEANWWAPPLLRRLHRRLGFSESGEG